MEDALTQQSPEKQIACAGRSTGVKFNVEYFVTSIALLSWFKDNGGYWDDRTCEAAFVGGVEEVLTWARDQGCPWDSGVLREWRMQYNMLRQEWDEKEPVTTWYGITYGDWGDSKRVVEICIRNKQLASVPA
ncbi:MAG: hypothetical protein QMA97_06500, partial [Glaciecola sp.]